LVKTILQGGPFQGGQINFGCVTVGEEKVFWKIDYYEPTLCYGSNDSADPTQTARVITIMLAHEY
jgi:hypothetical protein